MSKNKRFKNKDIVWFGGNLYRVTNYSRKTGYDLEKILPDKNGNYPTHYGMHESFLTKE